MYVFFKENTYILNLVQYRCCLNLSYNNIILKKLFYIVDFIIDLVMVIFYNLAIF